MKKLLPLIFILLISEMVLGGVRRFRCIWNDDPSTTMTIGFDQYNSSVNPLADEGVPALYYDVVNHGQDASLYANSEAMTRVEDHKGMENNFVRLTGLQPGTRYYFMVKDDQEVSNVMFFETCSDDPTERLSIIAGGDSRDIPILDDDIGRQNANKMVAKLRADAVLFGGDMTFSDDVTHPLDANEWPEWMDDWQLTIAADGRMTPIIPARGNHELDNNSIYHFFDTSNSDIYYALSLGGDLLRTTTLNSEISRLGNQLNWLENEMATSCATWKLVQYHRPTRPHDSDKDEQDDQANFWSPVFEEFGVQMVLESDAHLCKYTYPLLRSDDAGNTEGFIRDDENGVVYIGEGGWGAELRTVDDDKDWTMSHGTFNQFKWLFIDQDKIEVRTVITDNADDVVAKTDTDSKFSMPANIDVWMPTPADNGSGNMTYNGGVLTMNNPNVTNLTVDLGMDLEISTGTPTTIDAGSGFDTYTWSTGETTPTISISSMGTYSVTVTINGCSATDEVNVSETIGIEELNKDLYQFSVSPNPATQYIDAFITSKLNTNMNLILMNVEGKILKRKEVNINLGENVEAFNLSDMNSGIYFLALEKDGARNVQKFMIVK